VKSFTGRKRTLVALAAVVAVAVPVSAWAATTFYESPIFGITSSGSTLLVADAGQGIVNGDTGALVASLPAVGDVAARSGGGLWAITSGGEGEQKVYRVTGSTPTEVASLGEFEERHNPHPDFVESNPFDVGDVGDGRAVVADAAGNSVLLVSDHNSPSSDVSSRVKVVATLPNELVSTANAKAIFGCPAGPPDVCGMPPMIPAEPVATSVAVGPDGAFYVGELKGFPSPLGESRVWRIEPNARNAKCGQSPKCRVVLDGLTSIIDLAFGSDGRLNVAQIDDASWLAMEFGQGRGGSVRACNLATQACSTVADEVPILTSIAYRGSVLWGSIWSLIPEDDPAPFSADVVPLLPAFAP
jgi:hypothetical protein